MPDTYVGSASFDSWLAAVATATVWSNGPSTSDRYIQITGAGATVRSKKQPSRTTGGIIFYLQRSIVSSGETVWSIRDTAGVQVLRCQAINGTQWQVQRWNGAWTAVGAAFTPQGVWGIWRVDFENLNTLSGDIEWSYTGDATGTVVASGSVSATDLTAIDDFVEISVTTAGSGVHAVGPYAFQDTTVGGVFIYSSAPTAGGDASGNTGTYLDLDDAGTSTPDTDLVSLAASGNYYSIKNSAARNYSGRTPGNFGFPARLQCGATGPAQIKARVKVGGVWYYWGGGTGTIVTLTTTMTPYWFGWILNPATGLPWTAVEAQSNTIEFGIEVV